MFNKIQFIARNDLLVHEDQREVFEGLRDFVAGKRVAIVGPSEHLLNMRTSGELIDSYDVVVKPKFGFVQPNGMQKFYGDRCDVVYFTTVPFKIKRFFTENKADLKDVQFVVTADNDPYRQKIEVSPILNDLNVPHLNFFKQSHYSAGMHGIYFLLMLQVAELYVTGFSFYRCGNYPEYPTLPHSDLEMGKRHFFDHGCGHNWEEEEETVKKLWQDSQIEVDEFLQNLWS